MECPKGWFWVKCCFNVLVGDLNNETEHTLNKLADDFQRCLPASAILWMYCIFTIWFVLKNSINALSKSKIQLMTNQEMPVARGAYVGAGVRWIWKLKQLLRNKEQCEESSEIPNLWSAAGHFCNVSWLQYDESYDMVPFSFPEGKGDVFLKIFLEAVWSKNERYTSTGSSVVTDFGMKHLCHGNISRKRYPSIKILKNCQFYRIKILQRFVFLDLSWISPISFILCWRC